MENSSDLAIELLLALPLAAVLIGPNERIVAVNPVARALFGADLPGRHYITALRQPAVLDAVEQSMMNGAPTESMYLGREGSRDTSYRVHIAPVAGASGRYILVSFEDITPLEDAGKMRRDFVANVSHELRTPLTALLGFIETLRGAARNDANARDRFLGIMEREAGRMSQLVQDLLSLSRVEENERQRPSDQIDICGLIKSTISALTPLATKSGVSIAYAAEVEQIVLPADEMQMRQVFTNLIENAIKYGITGGKVEISVAEPAILPLLRGRGVVISVRDYGDGIAAHHIPRLTERFYRVDSHRSREVGGTGLGLAIVKHIVNRHRGRLKIESNEGEGTVFSVILPID